MELIGLLIGMILFITGNDVIENNKPQQEASYIETIEEPVYQRGRYFKSEDGYYISNLTPKPVVADGCDLPILTADLSVPRSEKGHIYITEVDVECDGS